MKSRFPTLALFLAFVIVAPRAAQTDEAHVQKIADIRKLMILTGGTKLVDQIFDQIGANMKAVGGPNGASVFQELRNELDFNKIMEILIGSYDKYLSAEDVKGFIQFYESPPGKHMIEATPKIMTDMISQMMPITQEMARKAMNRAKEQQKDK